MYVDRELQLKLFSYVMNDPEIRKMHPDIEQMLGPLINETLDRSEEEEKQMIQKQKDLFEAIRKIKERE